MPSVNITFERVVDILGDDNFANIMTEWLGRKISVSDWGDISHDARFTMSWQHVALGAQTDDPREGILNHILEVIDAGWKLKMFYDGDRYECSFHKGDLPKLPMEIRDYETHRMVEAYSADNNGGATQPEKPKTKFKAAWGM